MTLGPRVGISSILIAGSIVLLISIAVGNSMGNRVLNQVAGRADDFAPSPVASPTIDPGEAGAGQLQWKRHHIVSVATDPGFPDPRITPEPPPAPRPPPTPARTPTPVPTPSSESSADSHYTSPPLPLPIVSHGPDEQSDPYGEPLPTASSSSAASASPQPAVTARDAAGHAAMVTP